MDSNSTSASTPGQWRLSLVELFNWGTFDNYHRLDVNRDGLLITGASGSGKSTIIDAISTVMSPHAKMGFNAAANSGSKRDHGRNYSNYIRGAWGHESDGAGETTRKFLRPKKAIWSGILLRFEDGVSLKGMGNAEMARHEPICLAAVFFQKSNATSDDTLKMFYAVVRGSCSLTDLEPYGKNGADMAQFNKDFKSRGQAWRTQTHFLERVRSLMHINSMQTFTLLQKTQAAKNIGSLDDLFRRYMLEQPQTFTLADAAVEQFEELENAHRGVVRQREQMEMLAPLDEYDRSYAEQLSAEREAADLKNASPAFVEMTILETLQRAIEHADEEEHLLEEELAEHTTDFEQAKKVYETAAALLSDIGGIALSAAEFDVAQRQKELDNVRTARAELDRALAAAKAGRVPTTLHEYEALKRDVRERSNSEARWAEQNDAERVKTYGKVNELDRHIHDCEEELRHLRSLRSNIPHSLHAIRVELAKHVGLELSDLPFVGELIDVKSSERAWQPAIERLLRNRAQTLLVDKRHVPAISTYLESRHLGLRFEYDGVPEEVEVPKRELSKQSLVRKVDVETRDGHENLSLWVNRLLRTNFDYICVESPTDMARHSHALTRGGQVKAGDHHVKDDRTRIDDKSKWVLGSTNDAKIAQLESDRASYMQQRAHAEGDVKELEERFQLKLLLETLADQLEARSWESLDLARAEDDLKSAERLQNNLLKDDGYRSAKKQRDKAYQAKEKAEERMRNVQVRLESCHKKREELVRNSAEHAERLQQLAESAGLPTEAQQLQLRNLFKRTDKDYASSAERVYQAKDGAVSTLDRRIDKARRAQHEAQSRSELIMQQYKNTFKAEGANLTASFEDRNGFLARYRQIKATGLAQYEGKFLEVLTDFSQDQITIIATEIRNAFRDVRDRLEPVNRSLMLSPYAPGINLQIEVREARSARVEKFLADLRDIATGSWETNDIATAEQRYEKTAAVMNRLKSTERADREWRRECLSTPDHMKFIAKEIDADGDVVNVHSNDEGLSGGQKQKLVFFCLAAALRYQLSEEETQIPSYGTIILDEAFDKSDRHFAEEALNIFKAFNFHMVLATPGKLLQTIESHVGGIALVTCEDGRYSHISPITFEQVNNVE